MASEVDICNLALSRLGDDATVASINPAEGSSQAEHCEQFYPIARNSMLQGHDWNFATRRQTLAVLSVDSFNWQYAYAQPSNNLRIISVLPKSSSPEDDGVEFELSNTTDGTELILSNLEEATARFTVVVTDTTKFSALFIDALGWLLAAHLAGTVIKGDAGRAEAKRCYEFWRMTNMSAVMQDSNEKLKPPVHTPDWIGTRGSVNPFLFDCKITR
jgi:hypothetical protein